MENLALRHLLAALRQQVKRPRVHFAARVFWGVSFADRRHFIVDVDALAGGPGRAIDLALKLGYDISPRWAVTLGYRAVEGGADVEEIYNFAWFNWAAVSAVFGF